MARFQTGVEGFTHIKTKTTKAKPAPEVAEPETDPVKDSNDTPEV